MQNLNQVFPVKTLSVKLNGSSSEFSLNFNNEIEIPIENHPGGFAFKRQHHIHEGVDLYVRDGSSVFAIETGKVVNILPFTGSIAGSDWWHDTWCLMIEGCSGVINYGEILPNKELKIGDTVSSGQVIGEIKRVLKKDKGRPLSMLHLELYEHGVNVPTKGWGLNEPMPHGLKNPTELLVNIALKESLLVSKSLKKSEFKLKY